MNKRLSILGVVIAAIAVACGGSQPTTPTPPDTSTTLTAPVPRSPASGAEISGVRPTLEVVNAVATGAITAALTAREMPLEARVDPRHDAAAAPSPGATPAPLGPEADPSPESDLDELELAGRVGET